MSLPSGNLCFVIVLSAFYLKFCIGIMDMFCLDYIGNGFCFGAIVDLKLAVGIFLHSPYSM